MPSIGGYKMNRRELYADNQDQEMVGQRLEVIQPAPSATIVETAQVFADKGIPGNKLGPILDTGNAGTTSIGNEDSSIRFWAGDDFEHRGVAPFRVQKDGKMYATDAIINGRSFLVDPTYGDGSDGDVTISGRVTLTRDMFYDHLVVNSAGIARNETTNTAAGTSGDGSVYFANSGTTFTAVRNSTVGSSYSSTATSETIYMYRVSSTYWQIWRAILPFTNTVPTTGMNITAAKVRIYVTAKNTSLANQSLSLVKMNTDPGVIDANDYPVSKWDMTRLATDVTLDSITTNSYVEFTLNATGIALLNANKSTKIPFGIVFASDADSSEPAGSDGQYGSITFTTADSASNKPQLYIEYDEATVLVPNGNRVFAKSSITNNGTISANGSAGTAGTAGGAGGNATGYITPATAGTAGTGGAGQIAGGNGGAGASGKATTGTGTGGANGVAASAATNRVSCIGVAGADGVNGKAGGIGGSCSSPSSYSAGAVGALGALSVGGTITAPAQSVRNLVNAVALYDFPNARSYTTSAMSGGTGGSGGGSSGGCSGSLGRIATGAGGGGGGAGGSGYVGNILFISSPTIINNGTISAAGGVGGAGGAGGAAGAGYIDGSETNGAAAGSGGGGGGSGGDGGTGGVAIIIYTNLTNNGTISTDGGAGGTGGVGGTASSAVVKGSGAATNGTNGANGNNGSDGNDGITLYLQFA